MDTNNRKMIIPEIVNGRMVFKEYSIPRRGHLTTDCYEYLRTLSPTSHNGFNRQTMGSDELLKHLWIARKCYCFRLQREKYNAYLSAD